jgi:glycosyltransferase involved in cell wall biosynthesis
MELARTSACEYRLKMISTDDIEARVKNRNPLVSIIVPMRNAQDHIAETLRAILCDSQTPLEIIIVNDGSTDASLDRLAGFQDTRIRIFEGPNSGISACLNAGLAQVRGSIVMRCDADDIFAPSRIQEQVNWLAGNPEFDAVCGSFSTIDDKGARIVDMPCGSDAVEITNELVAGLIRTHLGTFAVRSSLVKKIGEFREYFETAEDIDFQFRLSGGGRIAYVPKLWYFYRIHPSSVTHTQKTARRVFFEKIASEFQHQRRISGSDDLERGVAAAPPATTSSEHFTANQHIQGMLLGRAWNAHKNGDRIEALSVGVRALKVNPASLGAWKSIVALLLKPSQR